MLRRYSQVMIYMKGIHGSIGWFCRGRKGHLGYQLKESFCELKQTLGQFVLRKIKWTIIYVKFRGSMFIFLILCIDDIPLASGNEKMSLEIKSFSPLNFDMKNLGEAIYVSRIKVHRDESSRILGLS